MARGLAFSAVTVSVKPVQPGCGAEGRSFSDAETQSRLGPNLVIVNWCPALRLVHVTPVSLEAHM